MADLIAFNGNIRTQDPKQPFAQALAVRCGRILAVGKNHEIQKLARPGCETIDLEGRLTLPGLTECHMHFYDWAVGRRGLDLSGADSLAELSAQLKKAVEDPSRTTVAGGWILGQCWNESGWPEGRMPNRYDLDQAAGDRPVMLMRSDLHLAVANSRALQIACITKDTPNPDQGLIERDENGYPTGILQDLAINLVKTKISAPSEMDIQESMLQGFSALHAMGLTGIHDFRLMDGVEGPSCFRILQRLRENGQLSMRFWACLPGDLFDETVRLGLRTGLGDDFFRIGHVKLFADGSLGARTAWMQEPYASGGQGIALRPMDEILRIIRIAEDAGVAVSVHAIGDKANHELISVFEKLERERSAAARRTMAKAPHRIEHLQLTRFDDLARLAHLHVVGSVQPRQATDDIILTEKEIGERGRFAYRFRDMLDLGIPLAFGSDCPVASPNPLNGIHAAVTRQRENGSPKGGWYPDQRISIDEAVLGYTLGAAWATGRSEEMGSISPGKLADFIVLDQDIYEIEPEEILETCVALTVVGGKTVYQKES